MKYYNIIASLMLFTFMTSCEDIIELDLDNTEPRIIIEANLNASSERLEVIVSESNDFYQEAEQILLRDAEVEFKYSQGSFTLNLNAAGFYVLEDLELRPGEEVELNVDLRNESYMATTVVPLPVSLTELEAVEFQVPIGPEMTGDAYQVFSTWQDQEGTSNYYRLRSFTNDEYDTGNFFVMSDQGFDGKKIIRPLRLPFESGSKVTMELLSTDRVYYNYYLELSSNQSEGLNSAIPFNPKGNFTNNALGYFGAYHSSSLTIQL